MSKKLKTRVVKELSGRYDSIDHCFLVDYRGMKASELNKFRSFLKESKIKVNVVKNTLLKKVATQKGIQFDRFSPFMDAPVALVYSNDVDSIGTAKRLVSWTAKNKLPAIKGGYAEGKAISVGEVKKLAQLPSREVLLSALAGAFKSPTTRLARGLSELIAKFPRALNQYSSKKTS
ncbi:MAG: 50S ribosomal protein L10 [Planctomycetota bacterium]